VLVVDDNVDAAQSLAMLLEAAGHTVSVRFDGVAALAAAEAFRPDVAFLDIGLPRMDGYALARGLRALPAFASRTLIAMTGYGQPEDLQRARSAGFDHHLVKPADYADVEALLRGLAGATSVP
jgi:CheY-like chemotaxis protein